MLFYLFQTFVLAVLVIDLYLILFPIFLNELTAFPPPILLSLLVLYQK
uniref:Uncharacterized protein n=1 Tax=Siphoviridae sp. ctQtc11 TaxID=2825497 RepID=A0A8S5P4S7_9CAUD|nr:MAG TPA: hypothetical protein [Siphoviridae sp. ctQtc11]